MENLPLILEWVRAHGFAVFTTGDYNVNLVALRSPQPPNATPSTENRFNDRFFCVFKKRGQWISRSWACTTDPGLHYQRHPMNPKGCGAIYAPQQVRGGYRIGLHRNTSPALVQSSKSRLRVYRDDDRSGVFDFDSGTVEIGFGFNVHQGPLSEAAQGSVDRASAGCVVFQKTDSFEAMMNVCRKSRKQFGNSFTLTILDSPGLDRQT